MSDLQDFTDVIAAHLADFDFPSANDAIDEVIAALDRGALDFTAGQVKALLGKVRGARQFETLSYLAQAFMRSGCDDPANPRYAPIARRQYGQALIEMGQLASAMDVLKVGAGTVKVALDDPRLSARAREDLDLERREMLGLIGRAGKQTYIDSVADAHRHLVGRRRVIATMTPFLDQALGIYGVAALKTDGETPTEHIVKRHWPLLNMIALAARSARDTSSAPPFDWKSVAFEVQRELTKAISANPNLTSDDPWLLASLGEAYVATGDFREAIRYYEMSADSPMVDSFQLGSSIRQLTEVWGIDPGSGGGGGALIQVLQSKLIDKPGGVMMLGDNASHLLDLIDPAAPTGQAGDGTSKQSIIGNGTIKQSIINNNTLEILRSLRTGFEQAALVAGIYVPNETKALGTAFLVNGRSLHPSLGDRAVALTAAHVVSNAPGAASFDRVLLRFNEGRTTDGEPLPAFTCKSVLHVEAANELDFTVLEVDGLPPHMTGVAMRTPDAIPDRVDGLTAAQRRCWILGHADGGDLALALDNSRLLDIGYKSDGAPNADFLRYSASTLPGQSGGPVFDREWHLIGLHQSGIKPEHMKSGIRRLAGKPGRHIANEGLSLRAIVAAITAARGGGRLSPRPTNTPPDTVTRLAQALADPATSDATALGWFETPQVQRMLEWPDPGKEANRSAMEIVGYGAIVGVSQALRLRRNAGFDKRRRQAGRQLSFVSEGDSWFQFPLLTIDDTIDHLSRRYPVYCRAIAGMEITNILADTTDVMTAIEERRPDGILLSGGGNDLLGYGNIKNIVQNAAEGSPIASYLKPRLDVRIADFISLFGELVAEARQRKGDLKVFIHGYDHARTRNNGRWLRRPLRDHVGIKSVDLQNAIVAAIVDRFNDALAKFAAANPGVVHHVDCRGAVGTDEWYDELHPNSIGFGKIARAFERSIRAAYKDYPAVKPAQQPGAA